MIHWGPIAAWGLTQPKVAALAFCCLVSAAAIFIWTGVPERFRTVLTRCDAIFGRRIEGGPLSSEEALGDADVEELRSVLRLDVVPNASIWIRRMFEKVEQFVEEVIALARARWRRSSPKRHEMAARQLAAALLGRESCEELAHRIALLGRIHTCGLSSYRMMSA